MFLLKNTVEFDCLLGYHKTIQYLCILFKLLKKNFNLIIIYIHIITRNYIIRALIFEFKL